MSVLSQKEYVTMIEAGNEFSAHGDYWFYHYRRGGSDWYEVRTPRRTEDDIQDMVLEVENESLGLEWMDELRRRIR